MSSPVVTPASGSSATQSPLDTLQSEISALLGHSPTHSINLAQLAKQIPGLAATLAALPGRPTFLTAVTLTTAEASLTLAGTFSFQELGTEFAVSAVCSLTSGNTLQLVLNGTQGTQPITLRTLADKLGHQTERLPDLSLTGLALSLGTDIGDFSLQGTANWAIPFGNTPSVTVTATVAVTSKTAVIMGNFVAGGQTFNITCNLAKDADSLVATWTNHAAPLTWKALVEAAGVPSGDLPNGFTGPAFIHGDIAIDFSDRSLVCIADTTSGADAFVVLKKASSGWGFVIGVHQGPGQFELQSISKDLEPLDFLAMEDAFLVAASYEDDQFVFPTDSVSGPLQQASSTPIKLMAGLNFGATLAFPPAAQGRQRTLHRIVGATKAKVSGYIGEGQANITAALDGATSIPDTDLKLIEPNFSVTLAGGQVDAAIATGVIIPLGSGQTPLTVTGSFSINETQGTLTVNATLDSVINSPIGLHGLVLEDIGGYIGVVFDPDPGIAIGLEAGFALGGDIDTATGDKFAFGIAISPETLSAEPVYLYGKFGQALTLPLLLHTLVPDINLPSFFDNFKLSNVLVAYAQPPGQTLPDGASVAQGLALAADLTVFNFDMDAALNLTYLGGPKGASGTSGASGSFKMSPISFPTSTEINDISQGIGAGGNAFSNLGGLSGDGLSGLGREIATAASAIPPNLVIVTGATPEVGPSFSFSSDVSQQPMASGAISVSILGAKNLGVQISGWLGSAGFGFHLVLPFGGSEATLNATLSSKTNFSASLILGPVWLQLAVPIHSTDLSKYLGKINLNATLMGSASIIVDNTAGSISLNLTLIDGSLGIVKVAISFSVSSDSLSDFFSTVKNEILAQAQTIFKGIIADPIGWANYVKKGAITDAGEALQDGSSLYGAAFKALSGVGSTVGNDITNTAQKVGHDLDPKNW